ncbi:hypothetical protein ACHAXT_012481 [Thalassiosira profunda]
MKVLASVFLLAAVASAADVDKTEHVPRLRGIPDKAKAEFAKVMTGYPYHGNRACPAMKGCSSYDYCYTSGCGPCDLSKDECTHFDPNNRDTGGNSRACPAMKGCREWDYCSSSGCGACDMSKNECTQYDPNNRDTGGPRDACLTTGGCKHYDYCADMGCGKCVNNSCTMPEDYTAKKEE